MPDDKDERAADLEWLHRFLNCTVFGPPPSEIQRAHRIVDSLTDAVPECGTASISMRASIPGTVHDLRRIAGLNDHDRELVQHAADVIEVLAKGIPTATPVSARQPREPTEEMVEAAANYMADCWPIEQYGLGEKPWRGTARAILEAAFKAPVPQDRSAPRTA